LWNTPIVGTTGTTVGDALADMMQPDGYFIRQLDCLGQGLVQAYGLLAVPILGGWLANKGCRAYHRGFVDALAAHPKRVILSVLHETAAAEAKIKTLCETTPQRPDIAQRAQPRSHR
jgi:hypothetical protein